MRDTDYPALSAQELAASGHALYGAGWRATLAQALSVKESEIVAVESGQAPAPAEWRAQLISLAQELALRALEAANNLLWQESRVQDAAPAPRRT